MASHIRYDPWPEEALKAVAEQLFDAAAKSGSMQEDAPTRTTLGELAAYVHASVREMADVFFEEQRRRSYVTPKSFLELLALYCTMLSAKRAEVGTACKRLEGGVVKLREANASVAQMKIELSELQPILEQKSRETNQLLAQVQSETAKANIQKAQVEKEAAAVAITSAEVERMAQDAQADLDKALPAFESAVKSLKSLSKSDLVEVKGCALIAC
jgi:dynein heavy chain